MSKTSSFSLTKFSWGLLLLLACNSYAQDESFTSIQSKFEERRGKTLQEKMYVHTDKATYLAGDIIWFKIYNAEANTNKRLGLSKVAYIEIVTLQDSAILQQSIFLNEGLGNGSFVLPFAFPSGAYRLRAYTNWMKNSGSNVFFEKEITVINTFKINPQEVSHKSPSYYIDLFPEGGNLVVDLQSRVAFKITDSKGIGTSAKLYLLSNQDTMGSYSALKFGMGSFTFTPTRGKLYSVSVALPDGKLLLANLPPIYDKGYVMNLEKESEQLIKITVLSGHQDDNNNMYLALNNNEKLIGFKHAKLNDFKTTFSIPIKLLGDGINCFTIFDSKMNPVCERLYFVPPGNTPAVIMHTNAKTYETRDKVGLNFKLMDSADISPRSLSLSVYRVDSLQRYDQVNIANYLTLLSNLKGVVEAPDYYLIGRGADYDQNADNLMLTNGWRRFRWENILNEPGSAALFPLEYKGPIINGILVNRQNLQPVKDIPVFLSIPGRRFQFYATKTQDSGKFWFDVGRYFGDGNIIVQTKNNDGTNKAILKSPYWTGFNGETRAKNVFSLLQDSPDNLRFHHIAIQAQNIYFKKQLQYFIVPAMMDSLPFFGSLGKTYFLDDYTRFTTMEDIFREYVAEIHVTQKNGQPHITLLDEPGKTFFKENSLILVDGVPLFNEDEIFGYDPLKVQKLQVISKRYILGPYSFNGIASFITYKGNYDGLNLHISDTTINYNGMQYEREFYSPQYDTEYQYKSRIPDFRTTLFWSPEINCADSKGLSFYTSDFAGSYIANLQGLSNSGKPLSVSVSFEVKTKK